jgi:hypothetical protein
MKKARSPHTRRSETQSQGIRGACTFQVAEADISQGSGKNDEVSCLTQPNHGTTAWVELVPAAWVLEEVGRADTSGKQLIVHLEVLAFIRIPWTAAYLNVSTSPLRVEFVLIQLVLSQNRGQSAFD